MIKHAFVPAIIAAAFFATQASAATIVETLPDYDGPGAGSGFPIDRGVIGTFTYSIDPTATITSAFIGGTFGTASVSSSTASFDVTVDGFQITACPEFDSSCFSPGSPFRPFQIALPISTFASLLDGSVDLGVIQTTQSFVRYGSPTLTINFQPTTGAVPEPGTWAMMLLGFGALGFTMRRRRGKENARVRFAF